ncbi:MAG: DUF1565 domain-containing protein [Myxococcales bacterium]
MSPSGSDTNAGSQAAPFATLQKATNSASAGDTIWVRGGTYHCTSQITLSKSGTSDTNRTLRRVPVDPSTLVRTK